MIGKLSLKYYVESILTLISGSNFYKFPLLFLKKPILVNLANGLNFYVNDFMQIWVLKETILDNDYQKFWRIKNGDVVVDIGASIGDFSVLANKAGAQVFSFEKDESLSKLLRENLVINNCKNINYNIEEVKSLKNIFIKSNIKKCDFLKIDCEGCEYALLLKTDKTTFKKIKYIAMEAHLFNREMKMNFQKMISKLENNLFKVRIVENPVHDYLKFVFAERIIVINEQI